MDTEPEPPAPSVPLALLAVLLAELEADNPGLVDRLLARLNVSALRSQVLPMRGARAASQALGIFEQAGLWLARIAPLVRVSEGRKRRK